ncbi:uncharacterized protein LOC141718613 [Apium graveolens]|uniref:uncharacterized protein LOC141718613 n=1 Tax=Apium graveolens TaxID=4045 RepID=UPI003D796A0B
MRQRGWFELFKDYDANIQYHPGKIWSDWVYVRGSRGSIASLKVEPNLVSRVKEAQKNDTGLKVIRYEVAGGKKKYFCVDDEGVTWLGRKLCVPADPKIREEILKEAHSSLFSIHPGSTKM